MPAYSTIPSSITTLYIFAVVNLVALFHVSCVDADIIVISPLNKTKVYADMPSNFGFALPPSGLSGLLVVADPIDSCSPIAPPPDNMSTYFALIRRSQCDFDIKVLNAQKSGFKAAIVYNVGADNIFPMNPNKHGKDIEIPSVFVGETTGNDLLKFYTHDKGYIITLTPEFSIPLNYYLLPFAIIVGICFILMVVFMVAKFIRDRRRLRRSRLSREHLKKLPTQKFKKGDEYDVCAICLDEYDDGDKLRILPCSHAYHCKCVDPWLTGNKRTCPVCKRKVIPGEDGDSSDESDDDDDDINPNENTPLLVATISNMPGTRSGALGTTSVASQVHMSASSSYSTSGPDDSDDSYLSTDSEDQANPRAIILGSSPTSSSSNTSTQSSREQSESTRLDLVV